MIDETEELGSRHSGVASCKNVHSSYSASRMCEDFSLSVMLYRCAGGRTEVVTVGDNLHVPSLKLCHVANVQVSGGVKR